MTSDLATQLDALMADHKRKTDQDLKILSQIEHALYNADATIARNLERIMRDHDHRWSDIAGMVEALRDRAVPRLTDAGKNTAALAPVTDETFIPPRVARRDLGYNGGLQ